MYKAIIFDVSDTLVEYHPNWAKIYGAPLATPKESDMIKNRAALSCVVFPKEMEETYLQMMSHMPKIKQEMRVIPGVFETLNVLKKKYRLAIVSNHHVWLADRLRELKIYEYFQPVIIYEAVGIEKPDVRIMEIALNELDLPAEACLYVVDHPLDVLCAKKAGMDCAWIIGDWDSMPELDAYREDYRINNMTELISIFG